MPPGHPALAHGADVHCAPAQHIRELALKTGAQAWLAKPLAPEQLLAILSIVLSRCNPGGDAVNGEHPPASSGFL